MARSKKKGRGASRSKSERVADVLARAGGWRTLGGVVTVAVVIMALVLGSSQLTSRASAMIATPPDQTTFTWPVVLSIPGGAGPEQWPPAALQQQLLELAHARVAQDPNPLSGAVLARIGQDLQASGLFERVSSVQRRRGGVIEIQGRWRLPAGAVRHDGRDYLVGPGAELMPVRYEPGRQDVRAILGAAYNPPVRSDGTPAYAEPWPGDDVPAALAVLNLLRGKAYWSQVQAIDVSTFARDRTLEIITDKGTRVDWGGAPGEFRPGEIESARKLDKLAALYDRFGRIDANQKRVSIFYEYTDVDRSASGGG